MTRLYRELPLRWSLESRRLRVCPRAAVPIESGARAAVSRRSGSAQPVTATSTNAIAATAAMTTTASVRRPTMPTRRATASDDDCDGQLDEDCADRSEPVSERHESDPRHGARRLAGRHARGRDCILGYGGDDNRSASAATTCSSADRATTSSSARTAGRAARRRRRRLARRRRGRRRHRGRRTATTSYKREGNDVLHGGACHDRLLGLNGDGVAVRRCRFGPIVSEHSQPRRRRRRLRRCRGANCEPRPRAGARATPIAPPACAA